MRVWEAEQEKTDNEKIKEKAQVWLWSKAELHN